jgi:replicative DNA helicase
MLLEELKRDFIDLNKDQEFVILSFEFEMLIEDQLTRSLSAKIDTPLKEIYSANKPFEDLEKAREKLSAYNEQPIYYVDTAGTAAEIVATIRDFSAKVSKSKGLVVTLDHALLTKGKQTDKEKVVVDELMYAFVDLKKQFANAGLKLIIIVLGQLNREIEKPERVQNYFLHYPNRNDIFASSAMFTCSDYVIITHRPAVLNGIRDYYGPPIEGYPKGLPVKCPEDTARSMVYWHLLKERFGEHQIIKLVENFRLAKLESYDR